MTANRTIGELFPNRGVYLPPAAPAAKRSLPGTAEPPGTAFRDVLGEQFVKFSHHAEQRLMQRGIRLVPEQLARIGVAIDKAAAKGAKESLVLYNDLAFIVSVKNRTVVTAMDGESLKDHVFTQIDSAVWIK